MPRYFAPSLIAADRQTVASFLKGQGYATAAIGKWHLDFEYLDPDTGDRYSQVSTSINEFPISFENN